MSDIDLPRADKYKRARKSKHRWYKALTFLASIVVFCTTYALILPAITMECDLPEHTHTTDCYEQVTEQETFTPLCTIADWAIHQHSSECYDENDNLICDQADYILHMHDDNCYNLEGELWCDFSEVDIESTTAQTHQHDESCFKITTEPLDTTELSCTNTAEGHEHNELCYGTWQLVCDKPEHIHTELCRKSDIATENDETNGEATDDELNTDENNETNPDDNENQDKDEVQNEKDNADEEFLAAMQEHITTMIAMIEAIPEYEEIEAQMTAYEEAEDYEGYENYYHELSTQVMTAYAYYEELDPAVQEQVTNREKLLNLAPLFMSEPLATTDTANVTAVNAFTWNTGLGALIIYNPNGGTISGCNIGHSEFKYWYAIQIQNENGRYVVKSILSNDGSIKNNVEVPKDGFVLLYHAGQHGSTIKVSVGDIAIPSSDFWKTQHSYTGTVYGTIKFTSPAAQKNSKTNDVHQVTDAADTMDIITINLYDYGSGSTGKNINDKFNANNKYPGFQQNGGTTSIPSLDNFNGIGYFNFGDVVTDDLADGKLITLVGLNPQGINVVKDTANSPISRYATVMYPELKDGYPALADGTSLSYLWGDSSGYSVKKNTANVNYLFRYNDETGEYHFNSRENHAQFDASKNEFVLYQEIFTPNFIMYPFGNFMPFNDIVHDSKQVSQIDANYFQELADHANYLYQQNGKEVYANLATGLTDMLYYAQSEWGENWTAERALKHYFSKASELPDVDDDENNYKQISLDNLYSLDYDVPTDFYFGMEMKMDFIQPKNGLTGKDGKQPMVFYFTGDDDVWVYLDDVLFLDLSGIHRHVGGEIDFVNGKVKYYSLDTKTGDVSTTPYKTQTFAEILQAAGKSTNGLNANGTFTDYSHHKFNFYYMERGSGSGVCRMNFNFPLLRENSISVTKELSTGEQENIDLLGNPDFAFQVLKANNDGTKTDTPFIGANVEYDILDTSGNKIGTGTTDENGIFKIKANQTAVFSQIAENSGKYYVRELLDKSIFTQYGSVTVDGSSTTTDYDVTVDKDSFKGFDSSVKDMSDGSTVFRFNNHIDLTKLGSLTITKKLEAYPQKKALEKFTFEVTLDGEKLPVGTKYTVNNSTEYTTVGIAGQIVLAPDETAKISNILAGSTFTVSEIGAAELGYTVSYEIDGKATSPPASGTILPDKTVAVTVINEESCTSCEIPVTKQLSAPDGAEHSYTFRLEQIKSYDDQSGVDPPLTKEITLKVTNEAVIGKFTIDYPLSVIDTSPQDFYYKITEVADQNDTLTDYDESVYIVKITVTKAEGLQANIAQVWKDGSEITDKNIIFTNALIRYELPQTGGRGVYGYTIGGTLLVLLASVLLYKRHRLRKGDVSP